MSGFFCLYNDRIFMLFFADVSIFARPPFKTRRSHLNDINFFFSLAVFWLIFRTLKFSIPGSKISTKKT